MKGHDINKRRFERVFFSETKIVEAALVLTDTFESITVRVLNLSEGGLYFTLAKDYTKHLQGKNLITLTNLSGLAPFNFPREIVMEIIWVMDHAMFDHVGYGCEFVNLTTQQVGLIRSVIVAYLVNNEQR